MLYYLEGHGVLIEIGYMTNAKDFAYITSEKGKKEIATSITGAIISFFNGLDAISSEESVAAPVEESAPAVETSVETPVEAPKEELMSGYAIQLISSTFEVDTMDYQFKSYKGKVRLLMSTGKYKYKYCYGSYATREAAKQDLAEARKTFKDAYIVYFESGMIVTK
jgi:N-acetylmuramoyl-L-alanine amidase